MAYTSPRTWVVGEVLTAALLNVQLRDNLLAIATTGGLLKHEAGGVEVDISAITTGGILYGASAGVMAILAAGTDDQVLTQASGIPSWATGGSPGAPLVGSDTTERTTTSTSAATLSTMTISPEIAVGQHFEIMGAARKSSGAAARIGVGLTINAVAVHVPVAAAASIFGASAFDRAENGIFKIWGMGGISTYDRGLIRMYAQIAPSTGSILDASGGVTSDAAFPAAAITSILIRGISGSSSVTLGVDQIFVYAKAVS